MPVTTTRTVTTTVPASTRVTHHDLSLHGRAGAILILILICLVTFIVAFSTAGWRQSRGGSYSHHGLWESCNRGGGGSLFLLLMGLYYRMSMIHLLVFMLRLRHHASGHYPCPANVLPPCLIPCLLNRISIHTLYSSLYIFSVTNCKLVVCQQRLKNRKPGQPAINLNCRAGTNISVLAGHTNPAIHAIQYRIKIPVNEINIAMTFYQYMCSLNSPLCITISDTATQVLMCLALVGLVVAVILIFLYLFAQTVSKYQVLLGLTIDSFITCK